MNPRLKLISRFALQFPWKVVFSIFLGFSGALFNGVNTTLLVPVFLQLLGMNAQLKQLPGFLQKLFQPFDSLPEQYRLSAMLAAILLTIALKGLTGYINTLVNVSLRRSIMNRIREVGFKILLDVDIDYYSKVKTGDIIKQLDGEASRATGAVVTSIRSLNIISTMLLFIGILLSLSWQLTLVSTFLIGTVALVSESYIKRAKQFGQELTRRAREYGSYFLEVLNGIRLIRTVASEDREYQSLLRLIRAHEKAEFDSQMNSAAIGPINEFTGVLVVILIVLVGRSFFASQITSFSAILLLYLIVLFRLMPFVAQLNQVRNSLANTSASVELISDFLRLDNKPFMSQGKVPFTGLTSGIRFEDISFKYPSNNKIVLKEVSLYLPKGQTLALVGSSGSGKSTLADLLARFYDPIGGRILLDDVDLRDFDLSILRKRMGVVSQETFLFNDTIRNNIAYARPEATDDEVIEAAKQANAYEFIVRLTNGWDTMIGDRGVMLSGGQRQRISIARALLQDPDILILDEATSALDTVSERLVQQAIDDLSRDRTTLVIAHRLSTVRDADQIAVLNQGEVIEVGTHDELLKLGGKYSELWSLQSEQSAKGNDIERDRFLAYASHTSRTYLNSMLGALRLLADGMADSPEEQTELAEEAYHAAANILKLVQTMETFSEKSYY